MDAVFARGHLTVTKKQRQDKTVKGQILFQSMYVYLGSAELYHAGCWVEKMLHSINHGAQWHFFFQPFTQNK